MSEKKSFWTTLPGIVTAIGGLLAAIASLLGVLYQTGIFGARTPVGEPPISTAEIIVVADGLSAKGAEVYVDEKYEGKLQLVGKEARLRISEIPPGIHRLKVAKPGYKEFSTSVELTAQKVAQVNLALIPSPKPLQPEPKADAARLRAEAERDAARLQADAERAARRRAEADREAARLRAEAELTARLKAEAEREAERLRAQAEREARARADAERAKAKSQPTKTLKGYLVVMAGSSIDGIDKLRHGDKICGTRKVIEFLRAFPPLSNYVLLIVSLPEIYPALERGVCRATFVFQRETADKLLPVGITWMRLIPIYG